MRQRVAAIRTRKAGSRAYVHLGVTGSKSNPPLLPSSGAAAEAHPCNLSPFPSAARHCLAAAAAREKGDGACELAMS